MLSSEKLQSGPAAVESVTGKRPSYATYFRWTENGLRGPNGKRIRLEYLKCGTSRKTSREAVVRFFEYLTKADPAPISTLRTNRQSNAAIDAAEAQLADDGII